MRIEKHLIGQTFIVRYMEDTDSDIIGLGFLITSSLMWIPNRGHVFRDGGIILHPCGVFSNVLMQRSDVVLRKHLICQKLIVPYMTYADNGILFIMKAIEMKLCRVVFGVRLHRLTRFETGTVRKTEVIADRTI